MENIFKIQLNETIPLTKESISRLNQKTYFDGKKYQINDVVLHVQWREIS